ncbi:hypothetical protein ACFWU5_19380 [Nocardia sp. NPDC058640]|uniref:hypothetical protein n=1 Tax=Nocardia sp. NPDC058640 TaxID=3346571 RepID=UPI003659E6A3
MSFLDRVVLQTFSHTTVGKLMFDLVIVDRDTGRYPRFRWLLGVWMIGLIKPLLVVGNSPVPERPQRYTLPAVRRSDMDAALANPHHSTTSSAHAPMEIPVLDFDRPLTADECHSIVRDGIIDNHERG